MRRVVIVGCGGAVKSTLARAIAERTGLPVIHLDREFWRPGWVEPVRDEFEERVKVLMTGERWIIDGNYHRTLASRVAAADMIIALDLPTRTCLAGIIRRWWRQRGKTRPDMTPGCPERLTWEFVRWVWRFRRDTRPKQMALLESAAAGKAMHVLRSRGDVQRWLDSVPGKAA